MHKAQECDDNASVVNSQRATELAKKSGIALFTVAQGDARHSESLMNRLEEIARLTGGKADGVKDAHEATKIFEDGSAELQHTCLISYRPPESKRRRMAAHSGSLNGGKVYKAYTVRSKEGWFPNESKPCP